MQIIEQMNIEQRINFNRCLGVLISSVVVSVCVCIGVTMNLTTLYDVNFDHMGLRTFCMFTVNSNILCAIGMMLAIPYAVDGLREGDFHLPAWMVDFLFAGVTAVSLTFVVSLCVLAPVKGFVLIFTGSRFFLHGVCPVLAIVAFCFIITNHVISIKESLIALLPVMLYAMVYYFMVEILGPDNGGWDDFYGFFTRIPSWISLLSFMPLTFGVATVIRLLHNRSCRRHIQWMAVLINAEFSDKTIREQIVYVAEGRRSEKKTGNIVIPVPLIAAMIKNSGDELDLEEACDIYLHTILQTPGADK